MYFLFQCPPSGTNVIPCWMPQEGFVVSSRRCRTATFSQTSVLAYTFLAAYCTELLLNTGCLLWGKSLQTGTSHSTDILTERSCLNGYHGHASDTTIRTGTGLWKKLSINLTDPHQPQVQVWKRKPSQANGRQKALRISGRAGLSCLYLVVFRFLQTSVLPV